MHFRSYVHHHPVIFVLVLVWIWISLSMILRMWLKYPADPVLKKLFWSVILCVPFFGWLFYGGFFTPLADSGMPLPQSHDASSGDSHSAT